MLDLLKFSITADARTARAMAQVKGELSDVRGVLAGIGERAQRAGRAMRNIGLGASAAVTAPLALAAREAVRLYDTQMKAQGAVEQALVSTGGAAGRTAGELFNLASGLQAVTTFGDEDILQNVTAPLLTFTRVSGPIFDRAQSSVLDMATLMKMDLKSASVLVGKALNDPLKGLSALSRTGVQFSEDQKAVIASLVQTGDVAAAQAIILSELETQFGGQAAAAAKAPMGAFEQLKNAIGDVKEQLGGEVVPFLTPLVRKVQGAVDWFSRLSPEVRQNIVVFGGMAAAIGPVLSVLGLAAMGVTTLTGALAAMGGVLLANPVLALIAAVAAGAYLIYRNWDGISAWFTDRWAAVRDSAATGWAAIKGVLQEYTPDFLKRLWNGLAGWFSLQWSAVTAGAQIAWDGLKTMLSGKYTAEQLLYMGWRGLGAWFTGMWAEVRQTFSAFWEGVKALAATWPDDMRDIGKRLMDGLNVGVMANPPAALGNWIGRKLGAAAREALGVQSPSKEFREIGGFVMEGLGLGIRDKASVALTEMESVAQGLTQIGDSVGQSMSFLDSFRDGAKSVFRDVLSGASSLKDALGGVLSGWGSRLLNSGLDMMFDAIFPSAKGNVFAAGAVVPFAQGGVVNGPTLFPMSGRRTGLMGEAGPEAIMPLTRIGGRLGVRAQGGAQRVELVVRAAPGVTVEQAQSLSRDVSVQIVQEAMGQYDREALPRRVAEISQDRRLVG